MEYIKSGKIVWAEEMARRQEQLIWDRERDKERRQREKCLLTEYMDLCRKTQAEKAYKFQKQLDEQCVSTIHY